MIRSMVFRSATLIRGEALIRMRYLFQNGMDGCPFIVAFKSGFNLPPKVLASQLKVIYHQLLTF